jgi:hypothetical protein
MGVSDRPGFVERLRLLTERLDNLQAAHPFPYNLVTGALIGLILLAVGFDWWVLPLYALSWATIRTVLWREGGVLRRQYDARSVRVEQQAVERRRRRGY